MKTLGTLALLALAMPCAYAETAVGRVTSVSCHNIDGQCWVTIDNYSSSDYCNHVGQVRWDASLEPGKRWYATLLAAYLSEKTVYLFISSTSCSSQGYPTFDYGTVTG
jgi:hypothetical protein